MVYAVVHVCVMNNILMIIITLHSIEKSSNNISPIYLNKSTDNSSSLVIPIGAQDIHKIFHIRRVITQKYLKTHTYIYILYINYA